MVTDTLLLAQAHLTAALGPLTSQVQAAPVGDVVSEIRWPWMVPLVLVLVLLAGVAGWFFSRRPHETSTKDAIWVANSDYVDEIPQLQQWVRRYRLLQWGGVGALCVALVAAGLIAARPTEVRTTNSMMATRDIVLCLDVSGSMVSYDREVLDTFTEIVKQFDGERIALQIFNSTSRTVFPLTDDYGLVLDQLEEGRAALDPAAYDSFDQDIVDRYLLFTAGTLGNSTVIGSSLIGDGLASCSLVFDDTETERSRSIIFATDNDLRGTPVYTLQQAADLAATRDITVNGLYGSYPGESRSSDQVNEFRRAIEGTGGIYFFTDDTAAVDAMVDDVLAQQAVDLDSPPEVSRRDKAGPWFVFVTLGVVALFFVQWRLRE